MTEIRIITVPPATAPRVVPRKLADRLSDDFIEVDHAGRRYTRFHEDIAQDGETCLRQPWMSEREWHEKAIEFFKRQPEDLEVYNDRFLTGLLLDTAGGVLDYHQRLLEELDSYGRGTQEFP